MLLGGMLGLTALFLLGATIPGVRASGYQLGQTRRRLWLASILVAGAVVALEPTAALRSNGGAGVVVGGGVDLRTIPALTGTSMAGVAGGTPLRVEDSFGSWVRVRTAQGEQGWVEESRVAPLPPVPLR